MNTQTKLSKKVKNLKQFLNDFFSIYDKKVHKANRERMAEKNRQLIESINTAKNDWMVAKNNFELATTDDTVDYYAYKIKACEVRYEALLKKAKEQGLKADVIGNNISRDRM